MFRVLGERVLVKREIQKNVGGLMIPEEAKKSGQLCIRGEVLAIGSKIEHVKVTDTVYFSQYAGQFLQIEDSFDEPDLIVLREDEILAVQEGTNVTEPSD